MAGSPTAAWIPKRPEQAPADVSGPRFARLGEPAQTLGRPTRPFRFGSEDRPDPDPPLAVGSIVGDRYRIEGLLGEGGMGRVYAAAHVLLARRVALKLLRRDAAADPDNLARFRQEALAASRIGAPEIVEVVDFASHGEQTYMVMELLAGESLEDWMDRNASLGEGLAILASLCDGLAAAHRAAVVHRDIKPANVFLPAADRTLASQVRVKILDFGIAKITAGGEGFQTRQGALLGTPYYLAPERVMGAELTGAADMYSVGVILYEMLTGNVPFVADSFMGILANHVHTAPLDPRQAAPDRPISDAVARVCLRLLAKQPRERPGAEEVAAALRGLLERDAAALAAVEIGPRASAGAGADTQIIVEGTRPIDLAERPTLPPDEALAVGRSATTIGHAAMAGEPATLAPVAAAPAGRDRSLVRGLGLGLAISLAAAALGVALWLGLRDESSADAAAAQPPVEGVDAGTPSAAGDPAEPPPSAGPGELDEPSKAAPAPSPGAQEASAQPIAAAEPREPREPEPEPPAATEKPKPSGASKPKPDPKPEPEPEDEPPSPPADDPPEPQPPAPKPEPDPSLPTIKDDVYD